MAFEKRLRGMNALVTGGARGIGRAIALELATQGANVLVNYHSSEGPARALVDELEALDVKAAAIQGNVANFDEAKALIAALKPWGGPDILVNNASITRDRLLARMSAAEWAEVLDTNLTGAFNICRHAVMGMMRKRKGSIINISSVSGLVGMAGQTNYAASKAGLIGFTKSLAREIAPRNITVNAVAPGPTDTEMIKSIPKEVFAKQLEMIPLRRIAQPEEIAQAVAFLASDHARFITGQVLCVDCGMTM